MKSGTNTLHFTNEYLQNRDLNAVDQSLKNAGVYSNPRYDQSRLGANIGAPIIRNKWFIFGGFEYNPVGQASSSASAFYAPTAAGYTALAAAPGVSKTNLNAVQQYVVATAATPGAPSVTVGNVTVPSGRCLGDRAELLEHVQRGDQLGLRLLGEGPVARPLRGKPLRRP